MTNPPPQEPFILFRDDLARREMLFEQPEYLLSAETLVELEAVFEKIEAARAAGKWLAGYFSYEAGALFEPKLASTLLSDRRIPLCAIGVFGAPKIRKAKSGAAAPGWLLQEPEAAWSFHEYETRFARVHQHLREGDCYQANLTFPVTAKWQGDPAAIFDALALRQPVRHSAFVSFSETKILSRSPELFFKIKSGGWIESLPMKGTARRGRTPASDKAQKRFLASDPKNQSENRMIVDLLRNDISRISEVGTLSVPKLFKIETYETLHQMVSLVRAKLSAGPDNPRYFRRPLPLRLHHRCAEAKRHANPAGAGAEAARHLLRLDRLDRAGRADAVQRRHPHADALSRRRGGL